MFDKVNIKHIAVNVRSSKLIQPKKSNHRNHAGLEFNSHKAKSVKPTDKLLCSKLQQKNLTDDNSNDIVQR